VGDASKSTILGRWSFAMRNAFCLTDDQRRRLAIKGEVWEAILRWHR